MVKGKVKWFNATKGYGFIQPNNGGEDVFIHVSALAKSGIDTLNEGDEVSYELETRNGKVSAINLTLDS
ncbi:MAG: cold shock domain-containing protein [Holosporales bacterium]|nr:cold shock domain-containing protein [Holosporales bacterium]